jgi:hypothetical protein
MSREVAAACEGAAKGGAEDILVKNVHETARNIIPTELPRGVRIGRGWSGSLFSMVDGLQEGFDALAFTGLSFPGVRQRESPGPHHEQNHRRNIDQRRPYERISDFQLYRRSSGASR